MCVSNFYKGSIYTSRNKKVEVRCEKDAEEHKSTDWVVVKSSDAKYKVGDWFSGAMGHALPCKNPNGHDEHSRECRLHALDAVTYSHSTYDKSIVKTRKLVPNNTITDLIVEGSTDYATPTASVNVTSAKKTLSVNVVADPQKKTVNQVAKQMSKQAKQGRDKFGRFLAKTSVVATTSAKQGRDSSGRFLPKRKR